MKTDTLIRALIALALSAPLAAQAERSALLYLPESPTLVLQIDGPARFATQFGVDE